MKIEDLCQQVVRAMIHAGYTECCAWSRESKFPINEYYSSLLNQFLANEKFHPNTRGDVIWASKRYFSRLIHERFSDLQCVGAIQIQKYLRECHEHMKDTSIHNILLYLKKLYRFLKAAGYSNHDFKELLSMKMCCESKVLPAAMPEDVNAILNVLDMNSAKKYISLDSKNLKEYALDFTGIEVAK